VTVFKRKDRGGAWEYEFVRKGERFRGRCLDLEGRPVGTRTAALAAEERAKAAAQHALAQRLAAGRPGVYSIGQAGAAYLKRKAGKTASHVNNARLYVAEILGFFGATTPIGEIPDERIAAYQDFAGRQTLKKWRGGRGVKLGDVPDPADPKLWQDTGRVRSRRTTNNYLKALREIFAGAARLRDPVTRRPMVDAVPDVALHKMPRRLPRPMPDAELHARLATLPPWAIEAGELARLFALRLSEALSAQRRHVDHQARGLLFRAGDTKSGNDEPAFGGEAGWQLLQRLEAQAIDRGVQHLVTWPGPAHFHAVLAGEAPEGLAWRPLKSIRTSWRNSAARADVAQPHRFHDVRARAITEVAKVQAAAAQGAARHQDPATTAMYVRLAATEVAAAVSQAVDRRPAANAVRKTPAPALEAVGNLVGNPVGNRRPKRP
jgi:integrase